MVSSITGNSQEGLKHTAVAGAHLQDIDGHCCKLTRELHCRHSFVYALLPMQRLSDFISILQLLTQLRVDPLAASFVDSPRIFMVQLHQIRRSRYGLA